MLALCDTLLRLAEPPRLFEPTWSEEIIRETTRTLISEAWVRGYESLVPRMPNHEKDRHVLAAAVYGEAPIIVTLNLRHFRPEHLEPWGIRALHPQTFLIGIFRQEQTLVMTKLEKQASDHGRALPQLLEILSATVPEFVGLISGAKSGDRC
jgi:hypothetical protein